MSILRQANWLGQQRVDVPHLRAVESSIAADFDLLAGKIMAASKALVIKGFDLITTGAVGAPATSLQLNVAGGMILHPLASEAGSIFGVSATASAEVLSTTNSNVVGSFTAGQINFIGLDLRRATDDSTSDLVMFLDANSLIENPKTVPLARTLRYKIYISTIDFSSTPNLLPLAKVVTDSNNAVVSMTDCRQMMFRLGSGGSSPNSKNTFSWPGSRTEASFSGADKNLNALKDWADAVMTRLWELGGGEFWYATSSDRDVRMVQGQPTLIANSDNFLWDIGTQTLSWSGISFVFGNSTASYNTVNVGSAVIQDGYCLYVDLDRTNNGAALTPSVSPLATVGAPTTPGSRFIMAWRRGSEVYVRNAQYEVGRQLKAATTAAGSSGLGVVRLSVTPGSVSAPTVIPLDANGVCANAATGGNGAGFSGTGNGTGAGVEGTGGNSNGPGVKGTGGTTNGVGVQGVGIGSGAGGSFTAGASALAAVIGTATGTGVAGLRGIADNATGTGVVGIAFIGVSGTGGSTGVYGAGTTGTSAPGVTGLGGDAGGPGVKGTAGTAAVAGVEGYGVGAGNGVFGKGGPAHGNGVKGLARGNGYGVVGQGSIGDAGSGAGVIGFGADGALGPGFGTSLDFDDESSVGVIGGGGAFGSGVRGVGHTSDGAGVVGVGGGNGPGVAAKATGSHGAVYAVNATATADSNANPAVEVGTGHAVYTGGNPAATTGFTNYATPKNLVKVWAKITGNGSGGLVLQDGFNIGSVGLSGSNIVVNFGPGGHFFSSANYAVIATAMDIAGTTGFTVSVIAQSATSFTLKCIDAAGAAVNITGSTLTGVYVMALGAQ